MINQFQERQKMKKTKQNWTAACTKSTIWKCHLFTVNNSLKTVLTVKCSVIEVSAFQSPNIDIGFRGWIQVDWVSSGRWLWLGIRLGNPQGHCCESSQRTGSKSHGLKMSRPIHPSWAMGVVQYNHMHRIGHFTILCDNFLWFPNSWPILCVTVCCAFFVFVFIVPIFIVFIDVEVEINHLSVSEHSHTIEANYFQPVHL